MVSWLARSKMTRRRVASNRCLEQLRRHLQVFLERQRRAIPHVRLEQGFTSGRYLSFRCGEERTHKLV